MVRATQAPPRIDLLPAVPSDIIWRLRVDQYHQMIGEGMLTDDDPVELIEGWLVTKPPKNPPHTLATQRTRDAFTRLLPANWFVNDQEPITTEDSEPEPDVAIIRGEREQYLEHHPHPADVALVVEVADATLQRDRTSKKRLYARAGIPVYRIINLAAGQIEVYSAPALGPEPDYTEHTNYGRADEVPLMLAGREIGRIAVSTLLPPPAAHAQQ